MDCTYGFVNDSFMRPNETFRLPVDGGSTHKVYRLFRVMDNTVQFTEMVVKIKEGPDPPEITWEPDYEIPR